MPAVRAPGPRLVRFRHEIVAGVVHQGLSAYRRQLLYRRAADALRLAGDLDGAAAHARQAADVANVTGQAHAQRLAQQVRGLVFAHEPAPLVFDC